jgi:STIP1 family protein 1
LQDLDASIDVLFTNRALCSLRLNEPCHISADALRAASLNDHNVKAHYLLGIAYSDVGDFGPAAASFRRALAQLGPDSVMRSEIITRLRASRRREWEASRLDDSLLASFQTEARELLAERYTGDDLAWRLDTLGAISAEYQRAMDPARCGDDDVPPAFCCPISFEIMLDPVLSPASGQTYERAAIEEALTKKQEDPTNRAPLRASQLISNIALRQAIESFIESNPWCIDPSASK